MKNTIGMICGFIVGAAGFLFLFKILVIDHTTPEDELAPGAVVILAIITGIVCVFIGNWARNFFPKRKAG